MSPLAVCRKLVGLDGLWKKESKRKDHFIFRKGLIRDSNEIVVPKRKEMMILSLISFRSIK